MSKENNDLKLVALNYLGLALGSFIAVAGINLLLAPHVIAPGGLSGFTIVIEQITGIPMYLTYIIVNIPLILIAYKLFGKDAVIKTFIATMAFTIALKFEVPEAITQDLLLASILGGGLNGIGIGIVIKCGGTTGGTDLIGAIINYIKPEFKLSTIMFLVDFSVVVFAGVVERQLEVAIYSTIAAYATARGIDTIIEGLNRSKSFHIITDHPEKVADIIINDIGRGGTVFEGKGIYTNTEKHVLLCVVDRREFPKVKELVSEADPNVFMMITETKEVFGEGFGGR